MRPTGRSFPAGRLSSFRTGAKKSRRAETPVSVPTRRLTLYKAFRTGSIRTRRIALYLVIRKSHRLAGFGEQPYESLLLTTLIQRIKRDGESKGFPTKSQQS
jgi:hypothetical protein